MFILILGGGKYGFNAVDGEDSTDSKGYVNAHGSHCAGAIAASANNIGIRGVNASGTKIMACKFLGDNGSGPTSDAIKCFDYVLAAKKAGVNVSVTSNS